MNSRFLGAAMGILPFLLGGCSKPQPPSGPSPEITSGIEDGGFIDLVFAIRQQEKLPDGSEALHAYGMHHGREVGINVVLGPKWQGGSLDPGVPLVTYRGTVTYRSLGPASDSLLQVLDELYGTKVHPTTIRPETVFTAISLGGEPADLSRGETRIKLFFESDAEDRYAELFTNIDVQKGKLEIREKDPEYREAVIRALRRE